MAPMIDTKKKETLAIRAGLWLERLWENKEKAVFLSVSLWLSWQAIEFQNQPRAETVGQQTVAQARPSRVAVNVEQLAQDNDNKLLDEMRLYAFGPRTNPFNLYWQEEDINLVHMPEDPRQGPRPKPRKGRPKARPRSKPKIKIKPNIKSIARPTPKPKDKPKVIAKVARKPRPYEIPVNLVGWISIGDDHTAHFRDKSNGDLLQVHAGDELDKLGLTVLSVERTGVIVENDSGDRFILRDLVGAEDGGPGEGKSANGEKSAKPRRDKPRADKPRTNKQRGGNARRDRTGRESARGGADRRRRRADRGARRAR